jgi:peptide/nickel transport system permease protein
MGIFITKKVLLGLLILFLVVTATFFLTKTIPFKHVYNFDDPYESERLIKELYLDRPIIEQYGRYMLNLIQGDFGKSIIFREKVIDLITKRLPISLYLCLIAMVLSIVFGMLFGTICAKFKGSVFDRFIMFLTRIGTAVPVFWLGIVGIYFLGLKLKWLPIQGFTFPQINLELSIKQAVMPVFCLMFPATAVVIQKMRSIILDVIDQNNAKNAFAKGLNKKAILFKYYLKNTLIPLLGISGSLFISIIGFSILVEQVFNIQGIGRLFVSSVFNKDYILVQGTIFFIALICVTANLIFDIICAWLDPSLRTDKHKHFTYPQGTLAKDEG